MPLDSRDRGRHSPGRHDRETVRTYDRIAPLYDLLDGIYERAWKRGCGPSCSAHSRGPSSMSASARAATCRSTPPVLEVVGIDMSDGMLARARERARQLGRPVTLRPMNLLALDFRMGASTRWP